MSVSRARNAIMYSLTWTLDHLPAETLPATVSKVESMMKNSEMPSIPM